ncbi:MAG: hypothetical protein JW793_09660, partial [Acidobacteria bacterium]|nr:hypothetical protein [Acidobacteriota bacterium]
IKAKTTGTAAALAVLAVILASCPAVFNPEPFGRWNPLDPEYDAAGDPDAGTPVVIFISDTGTDTPVRSVTWAWTATVAGCTFRYEINQSQTPDTLPGLDWGDETSASVETGDGIRYIHVQARSPDGTESSAATAGALLDNTPPPAVTDFQAEAGPARVSLSWANPLNDFAGVMIRYDTAGFPAGPGEGTEVYTGGGTSFLHESLPPGVWHYYAAFVYDRAGNYSGAVQDQAAPFERSWAYIACGESGLAVVDVSDPYNPGSPVYRDTGGTSACGIALTETHAYLAEDDFFMSIVDISTPGVLGTPVTADTTYFSRAIALSGGYAFVAVYTSDLDIINVVDPEAPVGPTNKVVDGYVWDVAVSGNYAFLAAGTAGLAVIDVSNPNLPGDPVYRDTANNAIGIAVAGGYAFIADGAGSLAIINIQAPLSPGDPSYTVLGAGNAQSVTVAGGYAYVTAGYEGLYILEVSNPENPGIPVRTTISGGVLGVAVSGGYAYAVGDAGLTILAISEPGSPAGVVSTTPLASTAKDVAVVTPF